MSQLTPAGELWLRQRGVTLCQRPSESRTPFLLEVATPESLLVRENVTEAQIPAKGGYVGILPGHAALLSELGEGKLSYTAEGRRRALTVRGGWLEVSGDHVRVLADAAQKEVG